MQTGTASPGQQQVILRIVLSGHSAAVKPAFVNAALVWAKSGSSWRIVAAKRTDPARLRQPMETKDLYPAGRDARTDIYNAQIRATRAGKNLIIVFGANWCYDCHVLDLAFEKGEVAPQEFETFVEALRRFLPEQEGGTPAQRFAVAVDDALDLVARILNKEPNPEIEKWVMEFIPFIESDEGAQAVLSHLQNTLALYMIVVDMKYDE